MSLIFYLITFIFGTCIGSFLNCLIYRLNSKQSFLRGRSFCPHCKHELGFFDLIPILSFIILKGKCRYCGKKISWQYPLVEIATGFIFLSIVTYYLSPITLIYYIVVSSLLIVIFVYDLKHYIIPDKIIYPAIVIVFLYRIFNIQTSSFYFPFLSALGAAGFFFFIWFFSRGKWMGFGDVKLSFFMGLFLGWPNILVSLFSAFFIGAIIGIVLIVLGKKTLKSQIPFGPFLVVGTFIALFWGQNLINWYINLII